MYSEIDIYGAVIANSLGTMLFLVLLVANIYRFKRREPEVIYLEQILVTSMVVGVINMLLYYLDGVPGKTVYWILVIGNTLVYTTYTLVSYWWFQFFSSHLKFKEKTLEIPILILMVVGLLFLISNIFNHQVFIINEMNQFERRPFYVVYFLIMISMALLTIWMYFFARRKQVLQFFPAILYCIPVLIAEIIQMYEVHLAIVIPTIGISLAGIIGGLKNEEIYRDQLTGIYNRTYLEYLKKTLKKQHRKKIIGMMIDLNGFKQINDEFGHDEGDQALILTADILGEVMAPYHGDVIRYSGDEFIVLMLMTNQQEIYTVKKEISEAFDRFNQLQKKPYRLLASIGAQEFNPEETDMSDFINQIDKKMYEDKKDYYNQSGNDRRRS